ncbi:MAG: CBS domain-containing protein [Paracoccaceae bacterium]
MLVRQILNAKQSAGVVTILPESTVSEAAETLSNRRFGALIVSSDGETPLGIISERDIVRELGKRGPDCLGETVEHMMTAKLVTSSLDETADQVLLKMSDGRFRHMPVLEDGKMVGLISIGDVVKARLSELAMEKDALEGMIMGH